VFAETGHAQDEITLFVILYVGGFVFAGVVAFVLIVWLQRKNRNPFNRPTSPSQKTPRKGPAAEIPTVTQTASR